VWTFCEVPGIDPANNAAERALRHASGSQCDATVRAKGQRALRLPTLVTTHRHAAWRWDAPAGAPRGRWRFRALCTHHGHVSRGGATARVRVERISERAGFVFPGSLQVVAGRYLHRPKSQVIEIDPVGVQGGGR